MERDAERRAIARANAYLNYYPLATWSALAAGVGIALIAVIQLILLWLFIDLIVSRGRLPSVHELSHPARERFLTDWDSLTPEERRGRLQVVAPNATEQQLTELAALDPSNADIPREKLDLLWRAQLAQILKDRVGPDAVQAAALDQPRYDEADRGILSLLVRTHQDGRPVAGFVAFLASHIPWTWYSDSSSTYLVGLLLISLLVALIGMLLQVLQRDMAARATIGAATRLRRAVYHHTFRLGTLAFRALGPTEAVTAFTRHIEALHDGLYQRLTVLFSEPIRFALLLLFALFINFWLAIAFLLFATFIWILGSYIVAYFKRQGRIATNHAGERLTVMRESLMLMRLVKCYLMEQFNQARVERQLARYGQVQLVRFRGEAFYRPLLAFLAVLSALLLLYITGVIVMSGQLGVAGAVAMTAALLGLYGPVHRYLDARKLSRRAREAAVQLFKFLDRRGEVGQVVGAEFLPPLTQLLEFDNVSLREPGGTRMLLQEVSLGIKAGQRIGIIGADDLEKHALVYLIPRLLDPSSGEIRIDQHNLRWVTLDSLRAQIAIVLQHNLVFHDSVANNIGCGDSAFTLPQIIEAAKVAHAHHFIQKLPHGYETPIGELGHHLSIGEQFRIGLARAILRDPALIIIEEPESDLDEDLKAQLDDTLARVTPGRTVIFLPHRISTIRSCDQIFLLHKGRLAASGQHKDLLANNPLYRHLHYLEFNEMDEAS